MKRNTIAVVVGLVIYPLIGLVTAIICWVYLIKTRHLLNKEEPTEGIITL